MWHEKPCKWLSNRLGGVRLGDRADLMGGLELKENITLLTQVLKKNGSAPPLNLNGYKTIN